MCFTFLRLHEEGWEKGILADVLFDGGFGRLCNLGPSQLLNFDSLNKIK